MGAYLDRVDAAPDAEKWPLVRQLMESAFGDPLSFDARRSIWQTFTLGYGHHECLGRAIAAAMIPEIVRQVLLLPNVRAEGPLVFKEGVPEHLALRWDA
ncbi:MAG TPA: hypothetical protein VF605_01275 [Allosphingosinicella sp.]|jgi:cytochrome P450